MQLFRGKRHREGFLTVSGRLLGEMMGNYPVRTSTQDFSVGRMPRIANDALKRVGMLRLLRIVLRTILLRSA